MSLLDPDKPGTKRRVRQPPRPSVLYATSSAPGIYAARPGDLKFSFPSGFLVSLSCLRIRCAIGRVIGADLLCGVASLVVTRRGCRLVGIWLSSCIFLLEQLNQVDADADADAEVVTAQG